MGIDLKEALGRLRNLKGTCPSYKDVASNVMCEFAPYVGDYIDAIIDLLERSDPDGWTDERLEEYGLVRLPRDKDGEFIRVGDVVWSVESGEQMMVTQILNGGSEGTAIRAIEHDYSIVYAPCDVIHRPPVTVESVLMEFLESAVGYSEAHAFVAGSSIAEYAKRLRLAESDE